MIVIITPMAFYLYIIFVSHVRENITFRFIPILLITRSNVDQIPRQLRPALPHAAQRLKPQARRHFRPRQNFPRSAPASTSDSDRKQNRGLRWT